MTDEDRRSGGGGASDGDASSGDAGVGESDADGADWPVDLEGVTESLIATRGPNGRWNVAALGLYAGEPVTAATWGNTRTRRNFEREGRGYVQFARDPVLFVDAALSIVERDRPIVDETAAWVEVSVERLDEDVVDGTRRVRWALHPVDAEVRSLSVPTIDRGFGAIVEATVAASRLGVPGYDDATLAERLEFLASVVERTGSRREREALSRLREHATWDRVGTAEGGTDADEADENE